MLPSPSDKTKWFLVYAAILAVAVCNIFVGQDWLNEPGARRAMVSADVKVTPMLARPPVEAARPAPPAAAGDLPVDGNPAAAPDSGAPRTDDAAQVSAPPVPPAPAAEPVQPKCDVTACAEAYISFQQSDCTFQPNVGPRRLCTRGTPPR